MSELLSDEQKEAAEKLSESNGGLLWWKVGEGKTRIAIAWCHAQHFKHGWLPKTYYLIVCRRKSFLDWRKEILLMQPQAVIYENDAPTVPPRGPAWLLVSDGQLSNHVAKLQDGDLSWAERVEAVVLDEGWLYANHKSARSIAAQELTANVSSLLLSGTVMKANNLLELYSQAMAVNKHKHIAPNPSSFRTDYQICQNLHGWPQWSPKPGAKHRLLAKLQPCASVNFPPSPRQTIDQFHDIEPTTEQTRLFHELRNLYFYKLENDHTEVDLQNALSVIVRASQISNGWCPSSSGHLESVPTNKVAKLQDELASILDSGERAIVWCAFRHDIEMLQAALPWPVVVMRGGEDFDMDRWRSNNVRICLATEASGSAVNHFDQTCFAIYFSANFKWKDMQQSRGRTDRRSSRHTACHYKYLQVLGGFDSHIYHTALASGSNEASLVAIQSRVIDWIKEAKL